MSSLRVTVLSKPNCVQCDQTKRHLKKIGIEFGETDITQDEAAYKLALDLGYSSAPVVIVFDENAEMSHWSGYRYDEIKALEYIAEDIEEKENSNV